MVVGVLALQGDFEAHAGVLTRLGAEARIVRTAAELEGLDALVIPGGESTTMTLGIEREELAGPLRDTLLATGRAFWRYRVALHDAALAAMAARP